MVRRVEPSDLPPYKDFLLPVLRAVKELGGTAHAKEITEWPAQLLSEHTTAEQASAVTAKMAQLGEVVGTLGPERLGVTAAEWQQTVTRFSEH